jgi:iron complex transport system substrate-binding protein
MPGSVLALAASAAIRAASLNLCTDEYLLLLGRPGEIVSVSYLSGEPSESALWRRAARHHRNRGTLEGVLTARPTLLLTMGGGGRSTTLIARRLGIRVVDLPFPGSLADVRRQAVTVAAALGDPVRAQPLLARLDRLQRTVHEQLVDAAFVSGSGSSLSRGSLGAQWLQLAGYRQRSLPNSRLSLETLTSNPPRWLIRSDYRAGQWSRGQAWLDHPLVRRLRGRTRRTDGRAWTCAGLPMIAEVERLRGLRR